MCSGATAATFALSARNARMHELLKAKQLHASSVAKITVECGPVLAAVKLSLNVILTALCSRMHMDAVLEYVKHVWQRGNHRET